MRLPESDTHFQECAERGYYHQRKTMMFAWSFLNNWRAAVDVGAHCGFMTRDMGRFFNVVYAFEPEPENYRCLFENTLGVPVAAYNVALGAFEGEMGMLQPAPTNSGAWEPCSIRDAQIKVPMRTLDSYGLENVDFLKIDVQGGEMAVLEGAEDTLRRCEPVIMVEVPKTVRHKLMKQSFDCDTLQFLMELGAKPQGYANSDVVLAWL